METVKADDNAKLGMQWLFLFIIRKCLFYFAETSPGFFLSALPNVTNYI